MLITPQHIPKIKGRHTSVQNVTRSKKRVAFAKRSNTTRRCLIPFTKQTYSRRPLSLFLIHMSLVKVISCCSASRTDTTVFASVFFFIFNQEGYQSQTRHWVQSKLHQICAADCFYRRRKYNNQEKKIHQDTCTLFDCSVAAR